MLQARVQAIYYIHDWQHPIKALHEQYEEIQKRLGVHQLKIADPDEKWANTREAQPPSNPREVMGNESLIISATPDGVGVVSQRLIPTGERSGLLTRCWFKSQSGDRLASFA